LHHHDGYAVSWAETFKNRALDGGKLKETVSLSELDLALINALQISPRASWTAVGDALGISPVTASRHWDRLVSPGLAWVTAHPGPRCAVSHCVAFVEVRCVPGDSHAVATALARDAHAISVDLITSDADLFVTVLTPGLATLERYIYGRIAQLPGVTSIETTLATQIYGEGSRWRLRSLDPEQRTTLHLLEADSAGSAVRHQFSPLDQKIFLALGEDGRLPWAALAAHTGTTPATARRTLDRLVTTGEVALRCDVAAQLTGWPVDAWLRAQVPPQDLEGTARALLQLPELRMCAAVTGKQNLFIAVWLRTLADIARLEIALTRRFSQLTITDRAIVLRTSKRMGHTLDEQGCSAAMTPMDIWSDPNPPSL
jgi:DNA-binding Lrp family transcriptional regulator